MMIKNIIPFKGIEQFQLGMSLESVRNYLKENDYPIVQKTIGERCGVVWQSIGVEGVCELCFAKDILFQITCKQGSLPNGIYVGMNIDEAMALDNSLEYNDDEEDYESPNGFWVYDNIEDKKVTHIVVFIEECMKEDEFWTYDWVERYKNK